jgi:putative transposase
MLVLDYKIKANRQQQSAIEEAIRTVQFVRNKCLRFWMDASIEDKINGFALNKYSTTLRSDFSFVTELNSMAVQAAAERAWFAISRFYDNCKKAIKGKKGYPRFQHDIPLLSNWVETLIFRRLKQCKFVKFSESDERGI